MKKRRKYVQPRMMVMTARTEWMLVASNRYNGKIDGDPVGGEFPDIDNGGEGNPDDIDAKQTNVWDDWD